MTLAISENNRDIIKYESKNIIIKSSFILKTYFIPIKANKYENRPIKPI